MLQLAAAAAPHAHTLAGAVAAIIGCIIVPGAAMAAGAVATARAEDRRRR